MSHIGPYELRGELGRGAMAVVWRAWDSTLEREVAVKEPLMRADLLPEARAEFVSRFQQECRTAARLNHQNIITVYDAGVFDGRPAVIMELVNGETLESMLGRGILSPQHAVSFEVQLLAALQYAHAAGVVHRDVKPGNVFVTNDGRLKLADFGIACLRGGSASSQSGVVLGSTGYMAPEQIRGLPADHRSDIFSAGVVLYQMLTARSPFDAGNPLATMDNAMNAAVPRTGLTWSGVDLDSIIAAATAKDPTHRYSTAQDMSTALGAGAASAPAPQAARNNRTLYIGLGAAAVVGVAAVAVFATGSPSGGAVTGSTSTTASNSAVVGSGLNPSGLNPQNDSSAGSSGLKPAIAADDEATLESELEDALLILFESSQTYSTAFEIRGIRIVQDDSGQWWGVGEKHNLEYDYAECFGLMTNGGAGWRTYALAYNDYGVYFEGGEAENIPSEVSAVLLADLQ